MRALHDGEGRGRCSNQRAARVRNAYLLLFFYLLNSARTLRAIVSKHRRDALKDNVILKIKEMTTVQATCHCPEFKDRDPTDRLPSTREELYHYIKHGPIRPDSGAVRKAGGKSGSRLFQAAW